MLALTFSLLSCGNNHKTQQVPQKTMFISENTISNQYAERGIDILYLVNPEKEAVNITLSE